MPFGNFTRVDRLKPGKEALEVTTGDLPQCWLWRLEDERPPIEAALPLAVAARDAVHRLAEDSGSRYLANEFHGGSRAGPAHAHAFWLPQDEDDDGEVDHLLVFCAAGIPAEVLSLLARVSALPGRGRWRTRMVPVWMGTPAPGGPFGPAHRWLGATPYVTPRWQGKPGRPPREKDRPEQQLATELMRRGYPRPLSMTFHAARWAGERLAPATSFALSRTSRPPPGDAVAAFPEIRFRTPVSGPLALGYGAHFGLGLLRPADTR